MSWKDPRTAALDKSIWRDTTDTSFRKHLVDLEERTNAVPLDMQTFSMSSWDQNPDATKDHTNTLPLGVEQQLADDFAFLAALEEGAQSVAATCLEQQVEPPALTVRFAALDMFLNETIKSGLRIVSSILAQAADLRRDDIPSMVNSLFAQVLRLHRSRLLARLRSEKWQKPKHLSKSHKNALWKDFANLTHRAQHTYTKKETPARRIVESLVERLGSVYHDFEAVPSGSEEELAYMQQLVRASFDFCTAEKIRAYARRLEDNVGQKITKQVASANKCFRQIEKVGAYWRISVSLVNVAQQYPALFRGGVEMEYLTPYASVPTTIGYETWAKTCHVHAEVQLAVHYDLLTTAENGTALLSYAKGEQRVLFHRPRAIGTSKYLCYLCYQFLRAHDRFFPANTHGRLYDQWTIPDLAEFDEETCLRYRNIVEVMDDEVQTAIDMASGDGLTSTLWRPEPMTSRQNLLNMDMEEHKPEQLAARISDNGTVQVTSDEI